MPLSGASELEIGSSRNSVLQFRVHFSHLNIRLLEKGFMSGQLCL